MQVRLWRGLAPDASTGTIIGPKTCPMMIGYHIEADPSGAGFKKRASKTHGSAPMGSFSLYALDVVIAVVAVVFLVKLSEARKHPPYPPSPPAEPLLGHARFLPQHDQAAFFHDMRKAYGTCDFGNGEGCATKCGAWYSYRRCDLFPCSRKIHCRLEQCPSRGRPLGQARCDIQRQATFRHVCGCVSPKSDRVAVVVSPSSVSAFFLASLCCNTANVS
jgi:hypothetical protein